MGSYFLALFSAISTGAAVHGFITQAGALKVAFSSGSAVLTGIMAIVIAIKR